MKFYIITAFPEFFESPFKTSLLGKAIDKNILSIEYIDLRNYAVNKHQQIDDAPYGGGNGMLLMVEPIHKAIEAIKQKEDNIRVILFSPRGKQIYQADIKDQFYAYSSKKISIILICGHYEGVDYRVEKFLCDDVFSMGPFIVSNGELCALLYIDMIARFIPGFMGNPKSLEEESFSSNYLEYPQYTRPAKYQDMEVPEVLLSGNHKQIKEWKTKHSIFLN